MAELSGYVLSYRSKWSNPVFRDLLDASIWGWMCETAAWRDCAIRFGGKLIKLKRGQLAVSRSFIAKGFRVGEQSIRTLFSNLIDDQMITVQLTSGVTIITICNYDKYQTEQKPTNRPDNQQGEEPTNQELTSDQPATNQNKNEYNKINKDNKKAGSASQDSGGQPSTPVPDFLGDENKDQILSKAKVRLAEAWELPDEWGLDAEKLGWVSDEILKESVKFSLYWRTGKGANPRKSMRGWKQAWLNWLANAERYSRGAA